MDMSIFNKVSVPSSHQELLDRTVLAINSSIAELNKNNGVSTPWTANEVHHNRKNGRKITRYQRLAEDGLHITEELKDKWTVAIDKAIRHIINQGSTPCRPVVVDNRSPGAC